jgi:Cof subfamily protein (haloacid dehalogenase superfamily)
MSLGYNSRISPEQLALPNNRGEHPLVASHWTLLCPSGRFLRPGDFARSSSPRRRQSKSLIATVPRLEIVVTPSYKRRKHFLTATRTSRCFAPETRFQLAEPAKINRKPKLIEHPVSYSKQRTVLQINRKLLQSPIARQNGLSSRSPLTTCHFLSRYNGNVPIKLIAMDIDGTLLDSSSHLSDANAQTVAEAAARGIEILLVTGRRFHSARLIAAMLPCEIGFIVNNGALLKSKDGTTQLRHLLPSDIARHALEGSQEFRSCAAVVFDRPRENQVILEKVDFDDPFRGGYFRRSREYISQVSPLTDCLNGEDPIQVMFVGACAPMRQAMRALENLPCSHEFSLSLTEYEQKELSILDVLCRGVSKGVALAEWARRRGIAREEVMAIGDNWNDREMLEYAGTSVVMGNAVEELKSLGHAVTLSNDQSGVAEAIRTYALDGNQ